VKLDENMTFEAAMSRLEEIVRLLESGNAPLDVSLSLYEEGVALVRLCNTRLDNAEQRVKILSFTENGEAIENDMTGGVTDAVH
jgi:exodeoxyribonuclease VII small subunit